MLDKNKKRTKYTAALKVEVIGSPKDALDNLPKDMQDGFYGSIHKRILDLYTSKEQEQFNSNNNKKAED